MVLRRTNLFEISWSLLWKAKVQNNITVIQNIKTITEEKDSVETFNNHCINFVEKSNVNKPIDVAMLNGVNDADTAIINIIIKAYKNHPSITKIKEIFRKNAITKSIKFHPVTQSHGATLLKQTDN